MTCKSSLLKVLDTKINHISFFCSCCYHINLGAKNLMLYEFLFSWSLCKRKRKHQSLPKIILCWQSWFFFFSHFALVMGAGGLNGELKTYSSDIDSQLRCNIQRFSREIAASSNLTPSSNTNFTPSSASRSVSPSRQDNSEQNMTCEDCGTNFTIFKRKVNINF